MELQIAAGQLMVRGPVKSLQGFGRDLTTLASYVNPRKAGCKLCVLSAPD